MMLRCTAKVLELLGPAGATLVEQPPSARDWYLNLLWVERRKCLLLTHAGTLFSVFVPDVRAADLRSVGPYITQTVAAALRDEALPLDSLGPLDATTVQLGRTADRHVLGFMNDLARHAKAEVDASGGLRDCDIEELNWRLRRTLHNRAGYTSAITLVTQRLREEA